MSGILHDLACDACGQRDWRVVESRKDYRCECGATRGVRFDRWSGMNVDLFGTPQYSDATGEVHRSQREKESAMRDLGFRPKGDKDHGARVDLSMKNSAWSYPGKTNRRSTGEGA